MFCQILISINFNEVRMKFLRNQPNRFWAIVSKLSPKGDTGHTFRLNFALEVGICIIHTFSDNLTSNFISRGRIASKIAVRTQNWVFILTIFKLLFLLIWKRRLNRSFYTSLVKTQVSDEWNLSEIIWWRGFFSGLYIYNNLLT